MGRFATTWCSAGLAALTLLAPRAAKAEPALPDVVVHRTDDAAECPDSAALAARVDRHMKRPALRPRKDPAGPGQERPSLDVQIYRSEAGYTAVVQTGEKTRQISDKGDTCRGLADAMAITLAILLDTEVPPPPLTPEPTPSPARCPRCRASRPRPSPRLRNRRERSRSLRRRAPFASSPAPARRSRRAC